MRGLIAEQAPATVYDALTLAMNVAQTCFLAWLAARYRR